MSKKKISATSNKHLHAAKPLIDADNVNLVIAGEQILADVSLCIHSGEFIGLVGPNGAGKTTLLKTLLGLTPLQQGKVTKNEVTISYIPQHGTTYSLQVPLSVLEVVQLGARGNKQRATKALKEVGLEHYAGKRFSVLSGGQKQRVLIAQALSTKPGLLILDEPTTGIDEASQIEFYNVLKELRAKGIAILMVSHDVDTVLSLVTRVICLNQKVVYDGSPEHFESDQYLPGFYTRRHTTLHHHHGVTNA